MKWIYRSAIGCFTIIFFLCICLSLIQMPNFSDLGSSEITGPPDDPTPPTPPSGPTITPGGPTVTPSQATCPNAGVSYPDNPFSGWPINRSWGDINYYYCDPVYEEEFGTTHWGIDFEAYQGEPVYATADGVVIRVANDTQWGMGKNIEYCTSTAWCAIYMHLTDWAVDAGDSVSKGDVLGYANSTGNSTGNHLHYQIETPAGYTVDPVPTLN
ncbi:MAG: M23 family metallopeptidase [Ardenticatenaceae bacterium]